MKDIKRIVLTGGPCAGKTTALVRVIEHFSGLGYKVFTIPEVPTMFTQAGMNYLTDNRDFFYEGEKATLEIQLALEDKFLKMAQACKAQAVIVCDRGTMDISAYMKPEVWEDITQAVGTNTAELRARYDAVLHLVSAADGAEQFYTTSNNASRNESADEEGLKIARMLDKKVIEAWTGHPHLRVINNNVDFDRKLNRVLKEICDVLGIPRPIEEERKYIVEVIGEKDAILFAHKISTTNSCQLCSLFFISDVKGLGLDPANLVYDEKETVLTELAEQYVKNPTAVSDELFENLRKFFNDQELVVIVGFAGQMIATNNFNAVFKIDVDKRLLPLLDEFKPATWRQAFK